MQNELRLKFLPLSARNPLSLSKRAQSQPTYKIRSHNRIKINVKRLPIDFFFPSFMPENQSLTSLTPKYRAVTQQVRRADIDSQELKYCTLDRQLIGAGEGEKSRQHKSQRRKRIVTQNSIKINESFQNSNLMNWTFSKQIHSQEKIAKPSSLPKHRKANDPVFAKPASCKLNERPKNSEHRVMDRCQKVNSLLTDKIAELNLNRLRMNVRKNNHPPSYLHYIKQFCG